jgi:predicted RND superfamily exporter protein
MIQFYLPFFNKKQKYMSVYEYVAENNPMVAERIMDSFGYTIVDTPDMGLSQLVAKVGEPALKKVMESHPDKEIIIEMFGNENSDKKAECGCSSCKRTNQYHDQYLNVTGEDTKKETKPDTLAHQTNVILVVATLFIVTALIYKNK